MGKHQVKQILHRMAHNSKDYFHLDALDENLHYVIVNFYSALKRYDQHLPLVLELEKEEVKKNNPFSGNVCVFSFTMMSRSQLYVQCIKNCYNDPQVD